MKLLFSRLFLFFLAVSVCYLFPAAVMLVGREYVSESEAARQQIEHPNALFMRGYVDQSDIAYKKALITQKKPSVIVVGTSRTFEFRKEFFADPATFVNAGVEISMNSIPEMTRMIEALPEGATSTTVVMGLDRELFLKPIVPAPAEKNNVMRVGKALFMTARQIYVDGLRAHKFSLTDLWHASRSSSDIGVTALTTRLAFRSDGSLLYQQYIDDPDLVEHAHQKVAAYAARIASGSQPSTPDAEKLIDADLAVLGNLAETCKEKNITLAVFMTPYGHPIYDAWQHSTSTDQMLLNALPARVQKTLSGTDALFYDLSTTDTFGGTDDEYVEETHGADTMQARIALFLAKQDDRLAKVFAASKLEDMIAHRSGVFLSF